MHTRLGFVLTAILGLVGIVAAVPAAAQEDTATVTGAAEAIFPAAATFNSITLHGLELGQGLTIDGAGVAKGQFYTLLKGTSLVGLPQQIVVEGEVNGGSVGADGSVSFSGTATLSIDDGTPPVPGVPFVATASTSGLTLVLNGTALPTATVSAGSITIE